VLKAKMGKRLAVLVCAAVWVGGGLPAKGAASAPVRVVRTPEGGVQPQALMDATGTVHLVYLKGEPKACDVYYARRDAGRAEFSKPIRVNSQPGSAIAIGTVRGAQFALGRAGRVHVVWNGSDEAQPRPAAGSPMLYSRLNDSGTAFQAQRNLMTSTVHLDGGGSVAADSAGNVYGVWHAHSKGGPQDEQGRGVFVATSTDDGQSFKAEQQINPAATGACGCCGLKAVADAQGRLAVLYRSATAAGNRDTTLLCSEDRGKTFKCQVLGPWRISACPMSTMALGRGPGNSLLAMWETQGQVYRAMIPSASRESGADGVTPEGSPGNRKHPAFAVSEVNGPRLLTAWTEGTAWQKGGALGWEYVDLKTNQRISGHEEGVPLWGAVAVVTELDGAFTVIY
jgi:hypothetical protein